MGTFLEKLGILKYYFLNFNPKHPDVQAHYIFYFSLMAAHYYIKFN